MEYKEYGSKNNDYYNFYYTVEVFLVELYR